MMMGEAVDSSIVVHFHNGCMDQSGGDRFGQRRENRLFYTDLFKKEAANLHRIISFSSSDRSVNPLHLE